VTAHQRLGVFIGQPASPFLKSLFGELMALGVGIFGRTAQFFATAAVEFPPHGLRDEPVAILRPSMSRTRSLGKVTVTRSTLGISYDQYVLPLSPGSTREPSSLTGLPQYILHCLRVLGGDSSSTRVGASGRDLPCSQLRSVAGGRPNLVDLTRSETLV
jgi:hypothetical protein